MGKRRIAGRSGLYLAIEAISLERGAELFRCGAIAGDGLKTVNGSDVDHTFFDPITRIVERISAAAQVIPALLGAGTRTVCGKLHADTARSGRCG